MSKRHDPAIYFVTDVELDGLDPDRNSMISFASVAVHAEKGILGQFEANLLPRPDRVPDAGTMAWWAKFPEAYAASTRDARDPAKCMIDFSDWVDGFARPRAFAARPLMLDGLWIDTYLRTFAATSMLAHPDARRRIFDLAGVDIPSFLGGLFGWTYEECGRNDFPSDWFGEFRHTHRAIDDAMGYAHLLLKALRLSAAQPRKNEDFREFVS